MRKYLVLFGAAVLVVALASPSLAQFKSWGHMEIQTIWENKPDFNTGQPWQANSQGYRDGGVNSPYTYGNGSLGLWQPGAAGPSNPAVNRPDQDQHWRHVAQRYRFYLQYGDAKTVRAVMGFEADSTDWGQNSTNSTTTSNTGGGAMGVYRADQVQLEIKHAYLDFTLPNTPVMITAGIFNFDIGGRLFMNNDAPGVMVTANFAPHRLRAWWWRENDSITIAGTPASPASSRSVYDVNDTYGLIWDMTKQTYNLYAYGAYKNDLWSGQLAAQSATFNQYNDHPWWLGVGGGWRPGNWDLSGQFIYVGGKRDFITAPDSTYQAYCAEVYAKYRIGPGMFAGLEGFYASGQNTDKGGSIKMYTIPTGSEGQSIFGNDRTVFFWMNAAQMGYYHERQLPFQGMWYGRANFEYSPLAWMRFNLNYLYIGDNNSGTPVTAGTSTSVSAANQLPYNTTSNPKQVNSPIGSRTDVDKDYVGSELNLITSLTIYPGFVYHIGLAIFLPGAMYDVPAGNAHTAYAVNTKLVYAF